MNIFDMKKSDFKDIPRFDLPCGYLHLWCNGHKMEASGCLSDFEIYAEKK